MAARPIDSSRIDVEHFETLRARTAEIGRASEDQLLNLVDDERSHDLLKARACLRLAHVGSEESLPTLERLASERAIAPSARFAHALICIRGGRRSGFLDACNAAVLRIEGGVHFLRSFGAPTERLAISPALEELGIEVTRIGPFATRIRSGKTRLMVLPTRDAIEHGFLELGRSRPALLGVLLQYGEEHRHWAIRSYVLTAPSERGVWVALLRDDGEIEMAGTSEGCQVVLNSLDCPNALPAQIQVYTAGIDLYVSGFTARHRKNVRQAIPAPRAMA